jgi:hypothetical protein
MARMEDAARLKVLAERIAALRAELAELRTERDAVIARLRTLPGATAKGRMAVKVEYGADGQGLFLVDLPAKAATVTSPTADRSRPVRPAKSPVDPDVEDH